MDAAAASKGALEKGGQAPSTPTSPLPAEEQGRGRGREAEGRVVQPQPSWGEERAGSKASPHSNLAAPALWGGGWGEDPRKSDPSPCLQLAPAPTRSLLAPEVQRVTLTSPGSHTHTHTLWGILVFGFLKKHVYKKKKIYQKQREEEKRHG